MAQPYERVQWMPESREARNALRWKGTNAYYQALKAEKNTRTLQISETELLGMIDRLPTPSEVRSRIMYGY